MAKSDILNSFLFAAKQYYDPTVVQNLTFKSDPVLSWFKRGPIPGENMKIPLLLANPSNISADFSSAQQDQGNVEGAAWELVRRRMFGFVTIGDETVLASQNEKGAFLENKRTELDGLMEEMGHRISQQMYRDGTGIIGRIDVAGVSGDELTLDDLTETVNFEVGMKIQASATNTSSAVARSGYATVQKVNRETGVITVDNASAIIGLAAQDYLFPRGDLNKAFFGFQTFIPATAPSDTFLTVDRSVDPVRFGGVRIANPTGSIEERLRKLTTNIYRESGRCPDKITLNPDDFERLSRALTAAEYQMRTDAEGKFGHRSLRMLHEAGETKIVCSRYQPKGEAFAWYTPSWQFRHLGPSIPFIATMDGNRSLRSASTDGTEIRVAAYGNVFCNLLAANGRVAL